MNAGASCFVNGCRRHVITTVEWLQGPALSACRVHDAQLKVMTRRQAEATQAQAILL